MVSDYVVTEHDTAGARSAEDGVAFGSYPADSHHVTYYVDDAGKLWVEGGFWDERTRPYPISYRALRPRAGECANLLVSGCVSASHVAYASVRMEPVFMMLGQACGAAAALAADAGQPVQDVPYRTLRRQLVGDAAILELKSS